MKRWINIIANDRMSLKVTCLFVIKIDDEIKQTLKETSDWNSSKMIFIYGWE